MKKSLKFNKLTTIALSLCFVLLTLITTLLVLQDNKRGGKNPSGTNPRDTIIELEDVYPSPLKYIDDIKTNGITVHARTSGQYFYLKRNGKWQVTFLKGVNMGLSLPDTDLANPDISYETYMEWFSQIKAMNVNTVKIFTIMNPDFYNALYDYNTRHSDAPLYLLQGMWINEDDMHEIGDAFGENGKIIKSFKKAVAETVDVINGNCVYKTDGKTPGAVYDKDISAYVTGFVLGLEWSPELIENTNINNQGMKDFKGKYLYTDKADPFEIFLAEVGDYMIDHEVKGYHKQRPVGFLSWSTTDMLTHSNEPFAEEDRVSFNSEKIRSTENFYAGQFAALDVYPYYPEFLNHQKEYIDFIVNGKRNPFRAYLRDLIKEYTMPVIVAEFGIPTSRGISHESVMGYNQGGVEESAQGKMVLEMMKDIIKEGYAGGMIFSWQDEWFKQTWNTIRYTPENKKQRPSNAQSPEQHYGILAADPGKERPACYPDGDLSEWQGQNPVSVSDSANLYLKYDERYLYLMGNFKQEFDFENQKYAIGIGLTGRGNKTARDYNLVFNKGTDYLIVIDGKENSKVLVDAYYDSFYYDYAVTKKVFDRNADFEKQNSGIFNPVNMFLSNEMYLPADQVNLPPKYFETGRLKFGNADPESEDYNSLADFYYQGYHFELRIPWQLINVISAGERKLVDDLYANKGIVFTGFNAILTGGSVLNEEGTTEIDMIGTGFDGFSQATYHFRLKRSYPILQEGFKGLGEF